MCQEFLYWSNQGWAPGAIINLNPGATRVSVSRPGAVADSLADPRPKNLILNQNRQVIAPEQLVLERLGNTFRATSFSSNTINYLNVSFTAYEHLVILDNASIFNDLIYDPITGSRQSRILVSGVISGDWDGTVNAPGFVLNQDNIVEWSPRRGYAKGEIVLFKNEYWSASTIIQPSQDFNYNLWIKSDYDDVQKGLLPNAANASDELSQAYSVYGASLQNETDLFSYGLIGFRPRDYMEALNLDDVSQVQLYQQFLGSKGTIQAAEIFSFADLGKETAQYNIYEYWALLRSSYGATANRNYIELLLDAARLRSDPSLVEVVEPQETSQSDQPILLENIYKTSQPLTSSDIFPTVIAPVKDAGLPTAGYVNLEDVDFTVFDLEDFSSTQSQFNQTVAEIGVGSTLWAAKINGHDWGVYRVETVPGDIILISDNLDARALVEFTVPHGLAVNDALIIRFFNDAVNGTYRVLSVPALNQVLIGYRFVGQQTEYIGTGVGFTLQTARVAQASDIADLPYSNSLTSGDRAWVDDNGQGRWTVLQKQQPFNLKTDLPVAEPVTSSFVGSSVAQGLNNLAAMVGAPGYGTAGGVYTYVKDSTDRYVQNSILELETTDLAGYGNAMDMANQTWAVVGASASGNDQGYAVVIYNPPTSNVFDQYQLLLDWTLDSSGGQPGDEFGYSVAISRDERWIYVGAPGANKVYGYGLVEIELQSIEYRATGATSYSYQNSVVVDTADQLIVIVDNVPQTPSTTYPYSVNLVNSTITFVATAPAEGSTVLITRRIANLISADGSTNTYPVDNIYGVSTLDTFTVYADGILQRPGLDYVLAGTNIVFSTTPAAGAPISIRGGSHYRQSFVIDSSFLPAPLSGTDRFGHSVATTTDGRQILIGAPGVDASTGRVYVFDRGVQRFQVTTPGQTVFVLDQSLASAPTTVLLNGAFLINNIGNINGDYEIFYDSSNSIELNSAPAVGDILEIENNAVSFVQEISAKSPAVAAEFGAALDQCVTNCSLYIGSPRDGQVLIEAGSVDYQINQARVYGSLASTYQYQTQAQPNSTYTTAFTPGFWKVLSINDGVKNYGFVASGFTIGDYLRVNDYYVEVTGITPAALAQDIINANIPNVTAISNNGYITIFVKNQSTAVPGSKLQVLPVSNSSVFADAGFQPLAWVQTFVSPVPQANANFGASVYINETSRNLIIGAPDSNSYITTTFDVYSQTLPDSQAVYGTPYVNNPASPPSISTTTFDAGSTRFVSAIPNSGAVYTYDLLPAVNPTITNPSRFVFGQQILSPGLAPFDRFGAAVNYTTGTLLVGSPGNNANNITNESGRVSEFININRTPAWTETRLQQPVVDIDLLNSVFMYDRFTGGAKQYFDYIDPLQGKLLGAVRQNLDYIGAIDPAAYNTGTVNNYGQVWAQARVGEMWWDTANARFIDPNQDDIVYASRRWSQLFPGSTVDVYQWIVSDVPPSQYAGPGTPRNTESYVTLSSVNEQGIIETNYYFWVQGIRTVARAARKTLGAEVVARYIESPKSSGIAYIAPINASTVAIYNGLPYISAEDTVLHVEYDETPNDDAVHVEYNLIAQDRADGFLIDRAYRKWLDSFAGYDTVGNPVPDPFLPESEKYGVDFRPRQSMFRNRFLALQNYLTQSNAVLRTLPISETRSFPLLNSSEPEPAEISGEWDFRVANLAELSYQDLATVPVGYRYLVESDSSNDGLWTIYEVLPGTLPGQKILGLARVQNYDTRLYWSYIDWYEPGYDPSTLIVVEVPNFSALSTVTVPPGSSAKVTANGQGKWEIYRLTAGEWIRVGLQDGTIEIDAKIWDYALGRYGFDIEVFDAQYFDQEPITETRKIIQSLNEEIFIDDLAIERNRLLILTFNYILSEQIAPLWLTKTSLIDVDHVIRKLEPFQIYRLDNQDFVLNYIQEVKPYHTQIREFNLIYQGSDLYQGSMTDFDVPAYWDAAQNLFVSPVLDDVGTLSTTSSVPSTSAVWQTFPWNQWYQNYLLGIESVTVVSGGTGYTVPPEVIVTGECERPAVMTAVINSAGQVRAIEVIDPGLGYLTTAIINLIGGNGTGAQAVANMGNDLVRNIKTVIRYDRYQYQADFVEWQPDQVYVTGDRVRYADLVWQLDSDANGDPQTVESQDFDLAEWSVVPADQLSGVDRTMGYYVPRANEPGLDLALLITGVDYPGVQVYAPDFSQNTGFDVGNYDINPFDNISFGPEGLPTYDPAILDTIYESEFTDPFLGVLPAPAYAGDPPTGGPNPIVVSGGAFVDTYSSHAPEELVPGAIFDTLDFRVYTTPGADWLGQGHGFAIKSINYQYISSTTSLAFGGLLDYISTVRVWNRNTGIELALTVDYTIDWNAKTVVITSGASVDDVIVISAYGLGGGNQIYRESYNGADVGASVVIPVQASRIKEIVVFANGEPFNNFTWVQDTTYTTEIQFNTPWTSADYLMITAMGSDFAGDVGWSAPVTQYILATGDLAYTLTNSLAGTNPANMIVTVGGRRSRPAEGAAYTGDGSTTTFDLPTRGGYDTALVLGPEVAVYVNNQPLTLGVGYVLDPADLSSNRTVTLVAPPAVGDKVLVSVNHAADYIISGDTIAWKPSAPLIPIAGDVISVTTWNDTAEQGLLTQVYQGPETIGAQITQKYDTTLYDQGDITAQPGSFDYSVGTVIEINRFDIGRPIVDASRITVSLNGQFIFAGDTFDIPSTDLPIFEVGPTYIEIKGPPISATTVVAITTVTDRVVPDAEAFRVFQDMRGQQLTYRIAPESTTDLAQDLSATADTIYVTDAKRLSVPNLEQGIFGQITIDGERITYRYIDKINNTVSGLRRGTVGTGAADHVSGSLVYDIGIGNLLPMKYQNQIITTQIATDEPNPYLGNGVTTVFVADDISVTGADSTEIAEAVRVYVAGTLQTSGYTIQSGDPVTVIFDQPPAMGSLVTIQVLRGLSWYQPGVGTASDGVPLQETDTLAARFIRGD